MLHPAPPRPPPAEGRAGAQTETETAASSALTQVRYTALLDRGEGVLYESDVIQVGLKTEFRRVGRTKGDVALFYGNKLASPLTEFSVHIQTRAFPPVPEGAARESSHGNAVLEPLVVQSSTPRSDDLPLALDPEVQLGHVLRVECAVPYACAQVDQAPLVLIVRFNYDESATLPLSQGQRLSLPQGRQRTQVHLALPLPISLVRFLEPVAGALSASDFFARWHQIGAANPREVQHIFPLTRPPPSTGPQFSLRADPNESLTPVSNGPASSARDHDQAVGNALLRARRAISRAGFAQLPGIDKNPVNLVGAGVLHTSQIGNVGCLLRLELDRQSGVRFLFPLDVGLLI